MKKDKKPLTSEAIRKLRKEVQSNPSLIREFVEDFEKALESRGYYITQEFRKKRDEELKKRQEAATERIPPEEKKVFEKVRKGETIRVKVKVNRSTKSKEIEIQ